MARRATAPSDPIGGSEQSLSSRDRMLAALDCQAAERPPCCFMQFTALERRCRDQFEMADQLLDWGLDATVQMPAWLLTTPGDTADLRGLPVSFHPDVRIGERLELYDQARYATLVKEYLTPAGSLTVCVNRTEDWPYGDHVPFLDDFLVARSTKPLVESRADLGALCYLLCPPSAATIRDFRESARQAAAFARKRGLLVSGGAGVGADLAGWLCGLQDLIYLVADDPDFVEDLMALIAAWNSQRMEVVLEEKPDLWVRRGWYEGSDFWSPRLYRRFILPHLQREVALAHESGVRFGYIMTRGALPLLDMILEAGVDVLIGVEPLKGGASLAAMKQKARGRLCLWGGVNAAITVEQGGPDEVRAAVHEACTALTPEGGFILSPVDDVEDPSERTWQNVQAFVQAWIEFRCGLESGAF